MNFIGGSVNRAFASHAESRLKEPGTALRGEKDARLIDWLLFKPHVGSISALYHSNVNSL